MDAGDLSPGESGPGGGSHYGDPAHANPDAVAHGNMDACAANAYPRATKAQAPYANACAADANETTSTFAEYTFTNAN